MVAASLGPALQRLDQRSTRLSSAAMAAPFQHQLAGLRHLDVSDNQLSGDAIIAIFVQSFFFLCSVFAILPMCRAS